MARLPFVLKKYIFLSFSVVIIIACSKDDDVNNNNNSSETETETCTVVDNYKDSDNNNIPDVYEKVYGADNIYVDGDEIVFETVDLPDHKSPFYPTDHALYEAYNGDNTNFSTEISLGGSSQDPDIEEQATITFRLPLKACSEATSHTSVSGGAIGIARNGVVFYSQYNGANAVLDDTEFNNTDQYSGHPSPSNGQYHYHIQPQFLTDSLGEDALIGFMLDGLPVYGPKEEDGSSVDKENDLDEYNGHFHATEDYPDGIYHYHSFSSDEDAPWTVGDQYYGVPGSVTK